MATILLSAAGAMIGGGFGGTVLGLSGAVIGRAVGATVGRLIDQRVLGGGSRAVETGRIDRLRLTGASEGSPVARLWGRMRIPGQVIWASPFEETRTTHGGKGPPQPKVTEFSYSVSLAIALCEGEILHVGRIWADGAEISPSDLSMRVYPGSETQEPDPTIEAFEGKGRAPAYRGMAYVVIEDLALARFGNRVPQLTFEVMRPAAGAETIADLVRGVAMIPGTGEYALATTPVQYDQDLGVVQSANQHSPMGQTDMVASLEQLRGELPNCRSVSLVVSWFGDDLRCGHTRLRPKVEARTQDGNVMPWQVSGLGRDAAQEVPRLNGSPIYGGTPADASVIEAIHALRHAGQSVMFYPFILMEQLAGNARPDPYGGTEQAVMPWRGRITAERSPGQPGSPDGSAAMDAQIAAFFGEATPGDFSVGNGTVSCTRADDWSYRRMVLHYAHLCAAAGGVDAFCIGSEMVGLTTLRGADHSFPAVAALQSLAADCRAILGPGCKIGYAADWSEYFGYRPGNGDVFFHLDPLWADANIDFVGIDNYLPLSDRRHAGTQRDASDVHDLGYLSSQIEGGEYYDWFYADPAHRAAQIRTPITDDLGEPWIWRTKDIRGWWSNDHHDRIGGVRGARTAWRPGLKPIWFTELGCAAIDLGTNQPNKFIDRYSSESALPYYSTGRRDDLIQMQYLRAMLGYWQMAAHNPRSSVYGGAMIDMSRAHVWTWDARPFPQFPARSNVWSDGVAYARGHWLNGRTSNQHLADVVAEICHAAGVQADVSGLHGVVRGYLGQGGETGRALLQPLMMSHGFDAIERDGGLQFRMRDGREAVELDVSRLAVTTEAEPLSRTRTSQAEIAGRVRLSFVEAEGDYATRAVEAILPDEGLGGAAQTEVAMALTLPEARHMTHRWLSEARVAQDSISAVLPPSLSHLGAGDVLSVEGTQGAWRYRVDHAVSSGCVTLTGTRIEPSIYEQGAEADGPSEATAFIPAVPVFPVFLDLPLIRGDEVPHAPHVAATANPWPGSVAVFASPEEAGGYSLNRLVPRRAQIGRTLSSLQRARVGVVDRGAPLRIRLPGAGLSSATDAALLTGANAMAIGDGDAERWEVFQFRDARLVRSGEWELSYRLRGQAGSDGVMPDEWPAGSLVVLLDAAPVQIDLPETALGLVHHYRIGNARRTWDDPSYVSRSLAFRGIGQRPYAPCHLRARRSGDGAVALTWVRRTRQRGDAWDGLEVPLAEAREAYLVRLRVDGQVRHEALVAVPHHTIPATAMEIADGEGDVFAEVAQISDVFGPGCFERINLNV